jgi:hypothetical protein
MPFAFGAFLRVDDVHVILEADRRIRTFEFAGSAHCALRGYDFVRHVANPRSCLEALSTSFKSHANAVDACRAPGNSLN